jgi:hypothetical protein
MEPMRRRQRQVNEGLNAHHVKSKRCHERNDHFALSAVGAEVRERHVGELV